MSDFLLEIFSEEIPAKMQRMAAENFLKIATEIFAKNNLSFDGSQLKTFVTPRRLVLYGYRINEVQKIPAIKRFGPKLNADKKAVEGFIKSVGALSEAELQKIDDAYVFIKPESEIGTGWIIKDSLPQILNKMVNVWPKLMRFDVEENGNYLQPRWIRPIRNIACVFGCELIELEFAGLKSNKFTFGQGLKRIEITNLTHYEKILEDEFIILNQGLRRAKLIQQIQKIKFDLGLELVDDEEKSPLIDEVVGLCEWPTALVGSIDKRFFGPA